MSESLIQKGAEVQGLSTAVLLPSIDLFGASARPITGAVGPLTPVVGIGLFQRTVLTLQRAGIRQLIVLVGSEEDHLKQAVGKGPRLTIPVRWMPIREFPLDDPRTWESLAAEAGGFCLLSGVGGIFSRPLIEQLRREVQEDQAVLVAHREFSDKRPRRRSSPSVAVQGERLRAFSAPRREPSALVAADVVVLPPTMMMGASTQSSVAQGTVPLRAWLERASKEGRVRVMEASSPAQWYQPVSEPADVKEAERRLFSSLKGEFEGFVDRCFNRKLSPWFTRGFVALSASPNAVTLVATGIGLIAAAVFGLGSYAAGVAGALLFQLAAVIDCCDGEVARLTFTESQFGAWLDIAMDNVVHMAIFAGIAAGVYVGMIGQERAWLPVVLGATAILGNGLSFTLVNRAQRIKQASEWKTPVQAAWSDFMLKNVASRDFSVIVLIFALLGRLDWFLWMAAVGSIVFALVMMWVVRPSAITRA